MSNQLDTLINECENAIKAVRSVQSANYEITKQNQASYKLQSERLDECLRLLGEVIFHGFGLKYQVVESSLYGIGTPNHVSLSRMRNDELAAELSDSSEVEL